jgi:hypothetical protein
MLPKQFTDPLGTNFPALERNIMMFRGMEMLLVIFYAEELKRTVLDLIRAATRDAKHWLSFRVSLRRLRMSFS